MSQPRLYRDSLQRLTVLRGLVLAVELFALVVGYHALGAQFPLAALATIVAGQTLLAIALARHMTDPDGVSPTEVFNHLLADAVAIAALVYLTGGYVNPFISLLLLPLIQATALLSARHAWVLAAGVVAAYTLLMREYRPLALNVPPETAVNLHLAGMWINFLFTAVLIAAFMGRLAEALRTREATLAREREERLRDERLFALGLQAASAAHELATPLASLRLTLDELQLDYAGDDELGRPLSVLDGQVARMERVLGQLRDVARGQAARSGPAMPAGEWLKRVVEHWGLMRPEARVRLDLPGHLPERACDPAVEAVLISLLNNAWEASRGEIVLAADVDAQGLSISVQDSGAGLVAGKPPGWGVGLDLARASLARLGGHLELNDAPGGGTLARIQLPMEEPPR